MWALRILNGPQAGEVHPLKGKIRIGRGPSCQIQLQGQGISKEHVEINVLGEKLTITDLRSSNGTFLNGVRIQGGMLKMGDKILVSQVMLDVVLLQKRAALPVPAGADRGMMPVPQGQPAGMAYPPAEYQAPPVPATPPPDIGLVMQHQIHKAQDFMDRVALPGVYRLPEVFEFRFVLLGFVVSYCLALTLLSLIPLNQITSESISTESKRRALTVARALSEVNQKVLRNGDYAGFRTDMIMKEEGIEDAYVVSKDGKILAPPERIGFSPKESGFVNKLRGSVRELTDTTFDGRVVASVPIVSFDAELQQNIPRAHAIVVYNPGNLTFDEGRAFSLFVQMLTLAIVVGFVLYYFMYKLIEYPYRVLHRELDISLREGRDQVNIRFNFPALQNLLTSLNSLLSRVASGAVNENMQVGKGSRDVEIANLMKLIGYPCILINSDLMITRASPTFEALTGMSSDKLINQKVADIPDPAMQQNINHLITQAQNNLSEIFTDSLEISGHMFNLNCQALVNASGDIEYYIVTVTPVAEEGAA